jgi:hypothetical protein
MTATTARTGARTIQKLVLVLGLASAAMGTQPLAQQVPAPLSGAHTIRQLSNGRYLDAHDTVDWDFRVVTRPSQHNATQRWIFRHEGDRTFTIQQQQTGRFLDAHDTANLDFAVVTRPPQPNTTQRWLVTHLGGSVYAIQQVSTSRYLDAYQAEGHDFGSVTRPAQTGTQIRTQRWVIQ